MSEKLTKRIILAAVIIAYLITIGIIFGILWLVSLVTGWEQLFFYLGVLFLIDLLWETAKYAYNRYNEDKHKTWEEL